MDGSEMRQGVTHIIVKKNKKKTKTSQCVGKALHTFGATPLDKEPGDLIFVDVSPLRTVSLTRLTQISILILLSKEDAHGNKKKKGAGK